ncbi:MAG: 4a-hydroxytetrahydrobiopterin dehydratase [Acidobacteria bacterium]|nr:4a-hydroxytetrahydrobiopterin dehydratase [Acidobacteriota bacterium]
MERTILKEAELLEALRELPDWQAEGSELVREYKLADFAAALAFVNKVGELAEAADHHPDIEFGWGYAKIRLTTHDRGGITDVDISLAKKIAGL